MCVFPKYNRTPYLWYVAHALASRTAGPEQQIHSLDFPLGDEPLGSVLGEARRVEAPDVVTVRAQVRGPVWVHHERELEADPAGHDLNRNRGTRRRFHGKAPIQNLGTTRHRHEAET